MDYDKFLKLADSFWPNTVVSELYYVEIQHILVYPNLVYPNTPLPSTKIFKSIFPDADYNRIYPDLSSPCFMLNHVLFNWRKGRWSPLEEGKADKCTQTSKSFHSTPTIISSAVRQT